MPLGEVIAEFGLQVLMEFVVYGVTYWLGFAILAIVSFGRLRMASFSALQEKNKGRKVDWSIWLYLGPNDRVLKAECVCLVGLGTLITAGFIIYWII